jgi:hypothetical protein
LRFPPRQLISAISALVVVAALAAIAQSKVGQSALKNVGVAAPPVRYTELAFVDPLHLPVAVRNTPSPLDLPFTITNRQHETRTYGWRVLVMGGLPQVAARGSVRLAPGAQGYLNPRLTLSCTQRARVTVEITTGQEIGFWARCAVVPPSHPVLAPHAVAAANHLTASRRGGGR